MIAQKEPIVFDLELLGADDNISFLFAAKHLPTGKVFKVWGDDEIGLDKVQALINNPKYVWVSFNGLRFDAPVLAAVLGGGRVGAIGKGVDGGSVLLHGPRRSDGLYSENIPCRE